MRIRNLYPGSFASNCYLLVNGSHAAVVDPSANAEKILEAANEEHAKLEFILLTHGHFDHIVSLDTLRNLAKIPALVHEKDLSMPEDAYKNGFYSFFQKERTFQRPDKGLADGDIMMLGDEEIKVISTPGHTAGSVCYLCDNRFLITGDTIFKSGYGRTDLYSGSADEMHQSLQKLRLLPPTLPIYPGHGVPYSLGPALDNIFY